MSSRLSSVLTSVSLVALLAGGAAIAYAWWGRPLGEADRAAAAGDSQAALERYRQAEQRFARLELSKRVFAGERAVAVYNQLALLYRAGAYDAVVAQAATAPADAAPFFWSGTAQLARALRERDPQSQLVWLTRAEQDLKQALQHRPADWDARFNYEMAARLAASLRRPPGTTRNPRMELLRPQPPQQQTPRRVG